MKLAACPNCRAQYDVTNLGGETFQCSCGHAVGAAPQADLDRAVQRCGACGALLHGQAPQCEYCGAEVVRDDAGPGGLICPECYARNADGCHYCMSCGVAFQPQPLPDSLQEWPCPCCAALMPARAVGGVSLNECTKCHGLWVAGDKLDSLVQRAIEAQQRRAPHGFAPERGRPRRPTPVHGPFAYRRCPVCEAFMLRQNYERRSGVILDVCSAHGTWLDADELEQIGAFILSGGLADARAREAQLEREQEQRKRVELVQHTIQSFAGSNPTIERELGSHGWVLQLLRHLIS